MQGTRHLVVAVPLDLRCSPQSCHEYALAVKSLLSLCPDRLRLDSSNTALLTLQIRAHLVVHSINFEEMVEDNHQHCSAAEE